jgi:YggT family protein
MLIYLLVAIHYLFLIYTIFIAARIIGSWFPSFARHKIMHFLAFYTDPYLNVFRRIIPPIGMLDLSPLLAFFGLQILERIITMILIKLG